MDAETLSKLLCRDIVHSVGARGGRNFIVTRFRYPDGEYVLMYVSEQNNRVFLSDLGTTLFKCTLKRIAPSESRNEFIKSVCMRYGMSFEDGELRKAICVDAAGSECLKFCEGITRISAIQMENDPRHRSTLQESLQKLLTRRVLPERVLTRRWSDPSIDPAGDYPVDFRIVGPDQPRNIFYVGSPAKSTLVAAVSSFFRLKDAYVPTMTIVDRDVQLGRHYLGRLQRANDKILFGVTGYEDTIAEFSNGLSLN